MPWASKHTVAELALLLPNLRLAWIPAPELRALCTSGLLAPLKDTASVRKLLEDALEAQSTSGGKRQREEYDAIPDHFMCPITHGLMQEPVMADDGHSYEKSAIAQ